MLRCRHRAKLAELYHEYLKAKWSYQHEANSFDDTLGFPGEGCQRFSIVTWNVRSLTRERFDYYRSLGYDILAITELWRTQGKYQTRTKEFIASEPIIIQKGEKKGQKRFPKDVAAGVGIMLSASAWRRAPLSTRRWRSAVKGTASC